MPISEKRSAQFDIMKEERQNPIPKITVDIEVDERGNGDVAVKYIPTPHEEYERQGD